MLNLFVKQENELAINFFGYESFNKFYWRVFTGVVFMSQPNFHSFQELSTVNSVHKLTLEGCHHDLNLSDLLCLFLTLLGLQC